MKKLMLLLSVVIILSGCIDTSKLSDIPSNQKSISSPSENNYEKIALDLLEFEVPANWEKINQDKYYSENGALFQIMVFDKTTTVRKSIDEWVNMVSINTEIEETLFFDESNLFEGKDAIFLGLDGIMESGMDWNGINLAFEYKSWIYLMVWDGFGYDQIFDIFECVDKVLETLYLR